MLNGAHSMLAYSGFIAGHAYVRDVMADAALAALVAVDAELDPLVGPLIAASRGLPVARQTKGIRR